MTADFTLILRHGGLPSRGPSASDYLETMAAQVIEVCLPFLSLMRRFESEGHAYRFCLECPPQLFEALQHKELEEMVRGCLEQHIHRLRADLSQQSEPLLRAIHQEDLAQFEESLTTMTQLQSGLLGEYRRLMSAGYVEPIVGPMTDIALTAHLADPGVVKAQLLGAVDAVSKIFGQAPAGVLLTESGYTPSMNDLLSETSVRYVVVDQQAFDGASAPLQSGPYAPLHSPGGGLALFAKQRNFSRWRSSRETPHADAYRRLSVDGESTWDTSTLAAQASVYCPQIARAVAYVHADDFVNSRLQECQTVTRRLTRAPHLLGCLDVGLRAQNWREVLFFLEGVVRSVAKSDGLNWITPGQYLDLYKTNQACWTGSAYASRTLTSLGLSRAPALHDAAHRLDVLVRVKQELSVAERETVDAALRELLWAQAVASDESSISENTQRYQKHLDTLYGLITPVEAALPDELRNREEMPVARPKPKRPDPHFGPLTIT
jgi:predicted glycosyl hydrolase (DUF1957 family)